MKNTFMSAEIISTFRADLMAAASQDAALDPNEREAAFLLQSVAFHVFLASSG